MGLSTLVVAGIGAALLGVVLFAWGWCGRRLDEHPVCRRCRFDLHGLPSKQERCPECGTDLTRKRATFVGNRARRPAILTLSVMLLALSIGLIGVDTLTRATQFDWNTVKPTWMLVAELETGDPQTVEPQLQEILRRVEDERVTESMRSRLLERALDVQGDRDGPWLNEWAELIVAMHDTPIYDDEHQLRYLRQAMRSDFQVRERIRSGSRATVGIRYEFDRLAESHSLTVELKANKVRFRGDILSQGGGRGIAPSTPGAISGGIGTALPFGGEPGPGDLEASWTIRAVDSADPHYPPELDELDEAATWTVHDSTTVEIVPHDQQVVVAVRDEQLHQEISESISVMFVSLSDRGGNRQSVAGNIIWPEPSIAFAGDVIARSNGREWNLGSVTFPPGVAGRQQWFGNMVDDFHATKVDIELKPSIEIAERHHAIRAILDEPILVRDVSVRHESTPSPEPR